ncbi:MULTISPECIES: hypothetical protein [unclassified Dietzia]|uniref:hypothetical protein n=1 Tax=unclassified Dietzia TaxID=2617939 RepID=UPI000D20D2FF|nr:MULTISPECIES: hypothetical protein [unclassified Dietzia]AVZ38972.1 hypothetical protein CT688_05245 [Dietzia sp. JS16-p6b]QGW24125.1 hypothetical protein GJR88_01692 [Dietzia sp. DQ12-45-1b]
MQKQCPDSRLDYIVEGIKFEGARVEYQIVEGQDPGWVLHVFEPKLPNTAMFKYPVREADVHDGDSRARLRSGLDCAWRMAFMD